MNIKELKELIKDLPDEMEVCSKDTRWDRFNSRAYTYSIFEDDEGKEQVIFVVE